MTDQLEWVPSCINIEAPSAARIYDYLLGGAHNFAADRAVADHVLRVQPNGRNIARLNREFLRRSVVYMVERGIRQFLDLGSGIPTVGNVHEVAQRAAPDCRVLYVDYEDVAVAHSQLLLESNDLADIVRADLTRPADVLEAATTRHLLDLTQPVGLLMVAVFHFVSPDRNPAAVVRHYAEALAPGSFVAISHLSADLMPDEMAAVVELMKNTRDPMFMRSRAEVVELFDGFELVEPGVVPTPLWHPRGLLAAEDDPERSGVFAGVGRKP